MGWVLEKPNKYDFSSRSDLKIIWLLFRMDFRNKNFERYCARFDIKSVTSDQINLVKKILKPHTDVTFNLIRRECNASAFMFEWTKRVIECFEIKKNLNKLGVKQIEDKIAQYQKTNSKMIQVFEEILKNQEF